MTWVQRLKRVFNIDIETCKSYGGQVKAIACIEEPVMIAKILTHLDRKDASGAARRLPRVGRRLGPAYSPDHGQPRRPLRGCDTERRGRVAIVLTVGTP